LKHKLIAVTLTIIFSLLIACLSLFSNPVSVQGGYAYGAAGGDDGAKSSDGGVKVLSLRPLVVDEPSPLQSANVTVRYIIAKPFRSLDELNTFLDYYREHKRIIFVANGQKLNAISDNCKEMAKDLQDMAAKQGYDFPTETLTRTEMYKVYGKWPKAPHRINKAWIPGVGEWYYDFNTDRKWRVW